MAEGLPVVVTAVGGTPEIIEDGENGMLVPPDEPTRLADCVDRLLLDSELRARLGRAALGWVRRSCAENPIAASYEGIFRELLRASRRGT
jgi:glycosyltransferase involved in cell wall biosynthesis